MTAEMNSLVNDPDFVVEFAMGDPTPELVPQQRGSGIVMNGLYFDKPKRYLMKKAHMSKDDVRVFDTDTGKPVLVSHHPGKNPYDRLDPLGLVRFRMHFRMPRTLTLTNSFSLLRPIKMQSTLVIPGALNGSLAAM